MKIYGEMGMPKTGDMGMPLRNIVNAVGNMGMPLFGVMIDIAFGDMGAPVNGDTQTLCFGGNLGIPLSGVMVDTGIYGDSHSGGCIGNIPIGG